MEIRFVSFWGWIALCLKLSLDLDVDHLIWEGFSQNVRESFENRTGFVVAGV